MKPRRVRFAYDGYAALKAARWQTKGPDVNLLTNSPSGALVGNTDDQLHGVSHGTLAETTTATFRRPQSRDAPGSLAAGPTRHRPRRSSDQDDHGCRHRSNGRGCRVGLPYMSHGVVTLVS